MKNEPLVSVIIPTYQRADFLTRAINSILTQTYQHIEVLVVDDNDPQSDFRHQTELVMETYANEVRVHYLRHPKNKNGAAARNTGLYNSHGKWVCFLDDDDWYMPQKIEKQVQYLQNHPEFQAVYCGYQRNGKTVLPHRTGDLMFELLSGISLIYTNTIMMERACALSCGGWDERFRRNQEAIFLIRYFSCGKEIGVLPESLVMFDTSDNRNRSNPLQFEEDFRFFLEVNDSEIQQCCSRFPDARERITSYRYRGVLINYIKYGNWKQARKLYREMSHKLPGRFTFDCIIYATRKLLHQPLFKEYE